MRGLIRKNILERNPFPGDIRPRFNTVLGRTYAVESENDLDNSWTTLSNNITGDGSSKQAVDSGAATLPWRFYRGVMLLP